jgi:MFS family permease
MFWRKAREPLAHRSFRYLFTAQAISFFGSALSPVALTVGILQLTHSGTDLGLTLAAGSIPTVVMLLIGGVTADRVRRNYVMAAANVVCTFTQLGLGIMLLDRHFSLAGAIVLQFTLGVARAFYFPASTGLTSQTVPAASIQPANALLSLARSASGSAGPLLAGLLAVTVGAGWALIADAITYIVAAVLLTRLKLPRMLEADHPEPFSHQIAKGWREVTGRSWVWSSILVFMAEQFTSAAVLVQGPVLLLGRPGGAASWSGLIACLSLGQIAGDVISLRTSPKRPMVMARLTELLAIPLLVAFAFGAGVPVLLPCALLSGIAMTYPNTLWYTALQHNLEPSVLARVSSYDWMGSLALRPLGLIAAPELGDSIGAGHEFTLLAAISAATCLGGLLPYQVRRLSAASA